MEGHTSTTARGDLKRGFTHMPVCVLARGDSTGESRSTGVIKQRLRNQWRIEFNNHKRL